MPCHLSIPTTTCWIISSTSNFVWRFWWHNLTTIWLRNVKWMGTWKLYVREMFPFICTVLWTVFPCNTCVNIASYTVQMRTDAWDIKKKVDLRLHLSDVFFRNKTDTKILVILAAIKERCVRAQEQMIMVQHCESILLISVNQRTSTFPSAGDSI